MQVHRHNNANVRTIHNNMGMIFSTIRHKYDFATFTMEHFVDWLAKRRQEPIHLAPWPMPPTLFGLWLQMKEDDQVSNYIFYDQDASPLHQHHIQLHELAHMLCGHKTEVVTQENLATVLQQILGGKQALHRSPQKNQIELEAETLSTLIGQEVMRHQAYAQLIQPVAQDERVRSLHRALDFLP